MTRDLRDQPRVRMIDDIPYSAILLRWITVATKKVLQKCQMNKSGNRVGTWDQGDGISPSYYMLPVQGKRKKNLPREGITCDCTPCRFSGQRTYHRMSSWTIARAQFAANNRRTTHQSCGDVAPTRSATGGHGRKTETGRGSPNVCGRYLPSNARPADQSSYWRTQTHPDETKVNIRAETAL